MDNFDYIKYLKEGKLFEEPVNEVLEDEYKVQFSQENGTYQIWKGDELVTDYKDEGQANSEAKRLNALNVGKQLDKLQKESVNGKHTDIIWSIWDKHFNGERNPEFVEQGNTSRGWVLNIYDDKMSSRQDLYRKMFYKEAVEYLRDNQVDFEDNGNQLHIFDEPNSQEQYFKDKEREENPEIKSISTSFNPYKTAAGKPSRGGWTGD